MNAGETVRRRRSKPLIATKVRNSQAKGPYSDSTLESHMTPKEQQSIMLWNLSGYQTEKASSSTLFLFLKLLFKNSQEL